MKIIAWTDLQNEENQFFFEKGSAVSIGSFDGPHKGHFEIFKKILEFSRQNGTLSGLVTFEKPVSSIKQGDKYKGDISTLEERLEIFRKLGFDFVLVIHFDEKFKQIEGYDFFRVLKEGLKLKCIVEGEDFCCGHNGTFAKPQIQDFCKENKISSFFIELVKEDGKRISSTMIRKLLAEKNIDKAERLLGY